MMRRVFMTGGAGFIGSHIADRLLGDASVEVLTLYDNFSSGREWHYEHHVSDARLRVIRGDVKDLRSLKTAMDDHEVVVHLASNPDIARAVDEPSIDFYEGTYLTHQVLEAMRLSGAIDILYASGSGVYGDLGEEEAHEDHGPLIPISMYGASKLASEALIASYCHMFGFSGCVLRQGNVVGPRQTHGVGFDFIRRLLTDPTRLRILGDGTQSKSYIHVLDVVDAFLVAHEKRQKPFEAYNVATGDYITVREIADLAVECIGLTPSETVYEFTGSDRGWKGDVPIVRMNTERLKAIGWTCSMSSKEAMRASMLAILNEARPGRL